MRCVILLETGLLGADRYPSSFGFITMIANLHHMDTQPPLSRVVDLLAVRGVLSTYWELPRSEIPETSPPRSDRFPER